MIKIRQAFEDEGSKLSQLALSSKSHWDYSDDFIQACVKDLTIDTIYIRENHVYVLERDEEIIGFFTFVNHKQSSLDFLYISPNFIGQGYGKLLWQYLIAKAKELGIDSFTIDSDPHAKSFYEKMGAEHIGNTPSGAVPGRMLPLMKVTLQK